MRLFGILCWYDEAPSWLAATVTSMVKHLELDHLVAVDGAYDALPEGRAWSGFEQHQVIDEVCRGAGVGLTMFTPKEPWIGNEIEKRAYSFKLAESLAEIGEDWYLVLDADEVVTTALGVRNALADTDEDVGVCYLYERFDPFLNGEAGARLAARIEMPRAALMPSRRFFRALPHIRTESNHYTYIADGGHILWNGGNGGEVPIVDTRMEVEHRSRLRDLARKRQQEEYYRRRSDLGIETTFVGAAHAPG